MEMQGPSCALQPGWDLCCDAPEHFKLFFLIPIFGPGQLLSQGAGSSWELIKNRSLKDLQGVTLGLLWLSQMDLFFGEKPWPGCASAGER